MHKCSDEVNHLAISTSFHSLSHAQTEFDLPLLSMLHITPVSLRVNCGYARTAIRELTPTKTGLHGRYVQSAKRSQEFRQLFDIPTYALQSSIFESDSSHSSTFDKMCDTVLNMFSKKWHSSTARIEYTATFPLPNGRHCLMRVSQSIPFPTVKHAIMNFNISRKHFL